MPSALLRSSMTGPHTVFRLLDDSVEIMPKFSDVGAVCACVAKCIAQAATNAQNILRGIQNSQERQGAGAPEIGGRQATVMPRRAGPRSPGPGPRQNRRLASVRTG